MIVIVNTMSNKDIVLEIEFLKIVSNIHFFNLEAILKPLV